MSDEIEIECFPDLGQVTLSCKDGAFDRLWTAVAAVAGPIDGAPPRIRLVLIQRAPSARRPMPWGDRIALFGCSVVGLAFLFPLVVGVRTIVGWMQ